MKRIVAITGAQKGIGFATAGVFSRNGWNVIGIGRRKGIDAGMFDHYIQADVAKEAGWNKIFEEIKEKEGHIDCIVNNAALQICKPITETSVQEWDDVLATNVRSIFLSVRTLLPLFDENGGTIINISSVHAVSTSSCIAAYAASKGAVDAFTRALALELAPRNIRVNAVLPGAVDTEMLREGLRRGHVDGNSIEDRLLALGKKHAIGRVGKTDEVAEIIFFLASDQSSFITGQRIVADGGALARLSTE